MDTYNVGTGRQQIYLVVDIRTLGLAASRAIIIHAALPSPEIGVAHSVNATGDISRTSIGIADMLQGKKLAVITIVALTIVDHNRRKGLFENTSTLYSLDGGDEGHRLFSNSTINVDKNYTIAHIQKVIDLL